MLDEQIDYTGCTLAELCDIAAHIDRERFAERAAVVDREIRRRNALPIDLQEAVSFEGGLRVGSFLYFGRTVPRPLVNLSFSTTTLEILGSPLAFMSSYRFTREEIPTIEERRGWLLHGFQLMHTRSDYPPVVLFLAVDTEPIRKALRARRWDVHLPGSTGAKPRPQRARF